MIQGSYQAPSDLDPDVQRIIKHKIRRLRGRQGINRHDAEDLAQELALQAHIAAPSFDPNRGSASTFFDRVLSRRLITLTRASKAKKRDRRHAQRFEDVYPDHGCNDADLRMDVKEAIDHLPHELRAIATLFMKLSEADVIRTTQFSRQTVRGMRARIIQQLSKVRGAPDDPALTLQRDRTSRN